MKRRFLSALAALFLLGAPIAACADPLHLDLTASTVSERNNNNLAKISSVGGTLYTHVGPATVFASMGEAAVRRAPSASLGGARYQSPVYNVGLSTPLNAVTEVTVSYGRSLDDGVINRAQPKTIRSLTLSGTVHVF